MKKSTAVLLGVGVLAAAGAAYLILSRLHAAQASASAPAPSQPQCYCDPTLNPNPGIYVINNQWKLVPGAQVYVDGKYVGTTHAELIGMGGIWPAEFTPCTWHDVKVYACDGTCARAKLGYFCYPGNEYIYNVIEVNTANCGGSMGWGDGEPEEPLPCD
jgi:hypothetical protein